MTPAPAVQVFLTSTLSREEARHKACLLVREGLRRWGLPHHFINIAKDAAGRPHIIVPPASSPPPSASLSVPQPVPATPDISLSHAPGLTAVALGLGCRVGVDVEPLSTHFPPPMFARIFSAAELAHPLADPVLLWTRKEALLKADGRGVSVDLSQVDVLEDRVELAGTIWHLHRVDAGPAYACCLASSAAVDVQVLHDAKQFQI